MALDSISQLGRLEVEKRITDTLIVKLRTLTATEYASVLKASDVVGDPDRPNLSTLGHLADVQILALSYATLAINGSTGSSEEFKKVYQNMQYPLLIEVYSAYSELLQNQGQLVQELKKNSMNNPSSVKTT